MLYYLKLVVLCLLLTGLARLVHAQGSVTTQTLSFSYTGQIVIWPV